MELLQQLITTRKISKFIPLIELAKIESILLTLASELEESTELILAENNKDLARMEETDPKYDRLKLTKQRIEGIATDLRSVAKLPTPHGKILSNTVRPNGMSISKITVPFGVIGIIFESRPNVTIDVFSLCLKSGNACVLKGGSDAIDSNTILVSIIKKVLENHNVDPGIVTLLPAGREATASLLKAEGLVDLLIPRGSQNLINYVRKNASIPVIETGAGICHTYYDEFGDVKKGADIVFNAKTRRVSVCNALDCLVIHNSKTFELPELTEKLGEKQVIIYADEKAYEVLKTIYPLPLLKKATEESFGTEFLDYKLSIKTVSSFHEALEHIDLYSSRHSEAIVSENKQRQEQFRNLVDASSVYTNVSTAFTDGAQFGLGAEIGISTQKLHARGPMALEELCSYKWIVEGEGQIRS